MNRLIKYISDEFLCGMPIKLRTAEKEYSLLPVVCDKNSSVCFGYAAEGIECTITAEFNDGNAIFSLSLRSDRPLLSDAALLRVNLGCADETLLNYHDKLWWMIGGFPEESDVLPGGIQGYTLHRDNLHYSIVTLCGDCFRAEGDNEGLHIRTGVDGLTELNGVMLTVSASTEPLKAIEENYAAARGKGAISFPLRAERSFPEMFENFGWCSWNAFYQNVSADKLYSKLDEFKEKNIPVHWIIIDDGWSTVKDGKLVAFEADAAKFPEGLEGCIKRIKEEYGIEQVGVWHAFNGYWNGVEPTSELASKFADSLMMTNNGMLIPSDDPDRAFVFWDAWHSYLASCGVDFLKVDNQSSSQSYMAGTLSTTSGARHAHEAIERSIAKNFSGIVIDCMGMDMENVLQRPYSAVSRNSDDFFPDIENGFAKHIMQNAYSATWHTQMYYCDYDMWWSGKSAPVQSGVLRAISGGPVYISDAVGDSCLDNILPVCGSDGDICRLDSAAVPTLDCVYVNCPQENVPLKLWNRSGDAFALAVYNLSRTELSHSFDLDVIPGLSRECEYVAYEYFSGKFTRVNFSSEIDENLASDEVRAYSLYPVKCEDDGETLYIEAGDTSRYFGIASKNKKKTTLAELGL